MTPRQKDDGAPWRDEGAEKSPAEHEDEIARLPVEALECVQEFAARHSTNREAWPLWTGSPKEWNLWGDNLMDLRFWSKSYVLRETSDHNPLEKYGTITSNAHLFAVEQAFNPDPLHAVPGESEVGLPRPSIFSKDMRSALIDRFVMSYGRFGLYFFEHHWESMALKPKTIHREKLAVDFLTDVGLLNSRTGGRQVGLSAEMIGRLAEEAQGFSTVIRNWEAPEDHTNALIRIMQMDPEISQIAVERIRAGLARDSYASVLKHFAFPFLLRDEFAAIEKTGKKLAPIAERLIARRHPSPVGSGHFGDRIREGRQ